MTSTDIKGMLFTRYPPPQYAFFKEVSNGTGGAHTNYADAIVYGLWPSAGHEIEGFEIKVSRGDFLNEMKNPQKAGAIMQYCHRWWLVAPKGVVLDVNELPATWGFMEIVNGKFFKRRVAPLLVPTDLTPSFVASMLRRATEGVTPNDAIRKLEENARKRGATEMEEKVTRAMSDKEGYKKKVEDFEKASGIEILAGWKKGKEVGDAVRFVLDGGLRSLEWKVQNTIDSHESIIKLLKELDAFIKTQNKLLEPKPIVSCPQGSRID